MTKFVARRPGDNLITLGLVLKPADIGSILAGEPQFCLLAEVGLEHPLFAKIGVYFFRDNEELAQALRDAGIEPVEEETPPEPPALKEWEN